LLVPESLIALPLQGGFQIIKIKVKSGSSCMRGKTTSCIVMERKSFSRKILVSRRDTECTSTGSTSDLPSYGTQPPPFVSFFRIFLTSPSVPVKIQHRIHLYRRGFRSIDDRLLPDGTPQPIAREERMLAA
jgi:hypothetical protein